MVKLQLEISRHITGFVHVQTNPYLSYDTHRTIEAARRRNLCCTLWISLTESGIVKLFTHLDSGFDSKRVCIKIPSSWEGLQACKALEASGISTLVWNTSNFFLLQAFGNVALVISLWIFADTCKNAGDYFVHPRAVCISWWSWMPLHCAVCEWAQGAFWTRVSNHRGWGLYYADIWLVLWTKTRPRHFVLRHRVTSK